MMLRDAMTQWAFEITVFEISVEIEFFEIAVFEAIPPTQLCYVWVVERGLTVCKPQKLAAVLNPFYAAPQTGFCKKV